MVAMFKFFMDSGKPPTPSDLSSFWHPPQFSKLYDSRTGKTFVAMLITSPEELYEMGNPDPDRINALGQEIRRYTRSKWAKAEAVRAANLLTTTPVEQFVVILEHAATGAYATRTQQVRAIYDFDGHSIGKFQRAGLVFEDDSVEQCVTI